MSTKKTTKKPAERSRASSKKSRGFTAEERAAMKERAREAKGKGDGESAVLEKIAEMSAGDRQLAERVHAVVMEAAPELTPKTWYGMPAYANEDGKNVCFFQSAEKFKARYATLGFNDAARLDKGAMWPTSFALKELTATAEKEIRALVRKAVG